MHPAILRFLRYLARQGKGICNALEQCLTEIEREGQDPAAVARADSVIASHARNLTEADLEAISKLITVHRNGQ